jgi:hypothetical protein
VVFIGVWLGCLGYLVHMLGNVAVHGATTPFWIVLASVTVPACRTLATPPQRAIAWRGAAVALIAVLVLAGAASFVLVSADAAYLRSRVAYREQTGEDPVEPAEQAVALNPLSVKYDRGLAEVVAAEYYLVGADAADRAAVQARTASLARADERFGEMLGRYPNDYAGHAWHAALLATAASEADPERAAQAVEAAERADALDRHGVQVHAILEGDVSREAILKALSVPGLP